MAEPAPASSAYTPRALLLASLIAGLLTLLAIAAVLSSWSGDLVEYQRTSGPSYVTDSIVGRYGLVLAVAMLSIVASIATVALLATQREERKGFPMAILIASVQLVGMFAIVAVHWKDAWWFILERGGPKLILAGAGAQVVALLIAGLMRPKA